MRPLVRNSRRVPCSGALTLLIVLTSGGASADSQSPWGVSLSATLSQTPADWVPQMLAAGVTSVRGFADRPDGSVAKELKQAGLTVSGVLLWSTGPVQTLPVNDLTGFRRYVVEQVSRYKGIVRHWEVWYQPPNFTADTSPSSYGKIVATAYEAAKSVDPTVQIGLAAKSVHIGFLAEAIEAGARDKFDFISLHPHETSALVPQGWEGPFLGIVPGVRAMLRDKDPARVDVPVWFAELGLTVAEGDEPGVSQATQADSLVKMYTMSIAQGAAQVHWFDPQDSDGRKDGLLRGDGRPRSSYRALTALTRVLGPTPTFRGFFSPTKETFGFLFTGTSGEALVAWTRPETQKTIELGTRVTVIDPRTGQSSPPVERVTLSRAPLVLIAPSGQALANAWRKRASTSRPPNWDGEPLKGSACLVAGQVPHGIHMLNPPTAKIVEGVAELDLSGKGEALFAIDPLLLNHERHAIRITAVVRGHGRGNPGFNLKYEAAAPTNTLNDLGMLGTGQWTSVVGTEATTFSWDITDARFVGKYGAHIAIDSDSATYSDFGLLSLSVAKL